MKCIRLESFPFVTLLLCFIGSANAWVNLGGVTRSSPTLLKSQQQPALEQSTKHNYTPSQHIHLLSLQQTKDDVFFSKAVKDTWRWKDSVLGDGRDFFVPKPKTLTRLNKYFMQNVDSIQECAVLSNCARFEILLVWKQNDDSMDREVTSRAIRHAVSRCVSTQVKFHQTKGTNMILNQFSSFDWPYRIANTSLVEEEDLVDETMDNYWTHLDGVESVCRHLSRVAAGMAKRPNRPDRSVPFRPFSSRDAHILLQLKRTAEVAQGSNVKIVLDFALSAGKAARDSRIVPQIEQLRAYGSDSKYAQEIPTHMSEAVAQSAMEQAIDPTVDKCVSKFQATAVADTISRLRQRGESMAQKATERTLIRKLLHEPTMRLRKGETIVDEEKVLQDLEARLEASRQEELVG